MTPIYLNLILTSCISESPLLHFQSHGLQSVGTLCLNLCCTPGEAFSYCASAKRSRKRTSAWLMKKSRYCAATTLPYKIWLEIRTLVGSHLEHGIIFSERMIGVRIELLFSIWVRLRSSPRNEIVRISFCQDTTFLSNHDFLSLMSRIHFVGYIRCASEPGVLVFRFGIPSLGREKLICVLLFI